MSERASSSEVRWLVFGTILLLVLLVGCVILYTKLVKPPKNPCCGAGEDCCEPPPVRVSIHVETINIEAPGGDRQKSATKSEVLDHILGAVQALVEAISKPIQIEVSGAGACYGNDCPALTKTLKVVQELVESVKKPIKVEISGTDRCPNNDCAPSIFVAGDLHWSNVEGAEIVVEGDACQLAWVGRVCGFQVGKADEGMTDLLKNSLNGAKKQLTALDGNGRLMWLVLIGRTDRETYLSSAYGGNRGLASARALWVQKALSKELQDSPNIRDLLEKRTIPIGSGPLHVPKQCPDDNPMCDAPERRRDRGVDIYACALPSAGNEPSAPEDGGDCGGPFRWSGESEGGAVAAATPVPKMH